MRTIPLGPDRPSPLWRVAQVAGVALTLVLLAALLVRPTQALHILWDMTIPLLPAVFLVNPMLWRNVCPLATLNSISGGRSSRRALGLDTTRATWVGGIVLLFVLVPARRFLFNTEGPALAVTITAVAVLALVAGVAWSRRSAFCNALCPVLPVEKLYGQSPLVETTTARCGTCTLCSPVGCIELAGRKTTAQTVGPTRRSRGWLTTSFGVFAAAFPGFVIGYFTLENGSLATAPGVYSHVALYAVVSYAIAAAAACIGKASAATALPLLGAASFMVYYWYGAPALGEAYGAPVSGTLLVRLGAAALIGAWLWRAWRRSGPLVALKVS